MGDLEPIKIWVKDLEVEVMQLVIDELVDRSYSFDLSLDKDITAFYSNSNCSEELIYVSNGISYDEFINGEDWGEKEVTIEELLHNPDAIWKVNTGKIPDLPFGTLVQCQLRQDMDRNGNSNPVEDWRWPRNGSPGDVIAWRVAEDNERYMIKSDGEFKLSSATEQSLVPIKTKPKRDNIMENVKIWVRNLDPSDKNDVIDRLVGIGYSAGDDHVYTSDGVTALYTNSYGEIMSHDENFKGHFDESPQWSEREILAEDLLNGVVWIIDSLKPIITNEQCDKLAKMDQSEVNDLAKPIPKPPSISPEQEEIQSLNADIYELQKEIATLEVENLALRDHNKKEDAKIKSISVKDGYRF